ncbi:MAG: HpcH/HpaI aldolase/citrate lyase family protein [Anaerolineae bacterium]
MRANRLRAIWQMGQAALNGWLQIPDAFSAEVMANQGWDSLTIDMQHGPVDYADALAMLQAISTTETVPLVRVPWNEPGVIMKMLDAGCYGIICPMVNSRAEAEAFVGACRYAPLGYRSYGPNRAVYYGGPDYAEQANETVITMAMIETAQALENLDDILSAPGLDAIYIGPADLSLSLGSPERSDPTEPGVVAAIDRILAAAKEHGIVAGIHTGQPAYARQMIAKGFQFVSIQSDSRLMAKAAGDVIAAMKGGSGRQESEEEGLY